MMHRVHQVKIKEKKYKEKILIQYKRFEEEKKKFLSDTNSNVHDAIEGTL